MTHLLAVPSHSTVIPAKAGILHGLGKIPAFAGMTILLFCLLLSLPAHAAELRVTIKFAAGSDPLSFMLSESQTRTFWSKWRVLNDTDDMVPIPGTGNYGGLTLYDSDKDQEVRLFSGIGRGPQGAKKDEFRQLERWVLTLAPPPLGPSLLSALDDEIRQQPGGEQAMPQNILPGITIIKNCEARAHDNMRLRAFCLHEQLAQQLDAAVYVRALEELATTQLPIRPGSNIETDQANEALRRPAAGRAGSR